MRNTLMVCAALLGPVSGCASLKVTKVSADKRDSESDEKVKGFRYYLSRPYVVVSAPVLVSEQAQLYALPDEPELIPKPAEKQKESGASAARLNPTSGALEPVSEGEMAQLRKLLARPGDIQQVGHKSPQAEPPVTLSATPSLAATAASLSDSPGDSDGTLGVGLTVGDRLAVTDPVPSGVGTPLETPTAKPVDTATAPLTGKIQVVFLPDLDEQYAVHNKNFLSKSAYNLQFKDGWQLAAVSGEFDSTTVPIEILNFIDSAIDAAKTVGVAKAARMGRLLSDPQGGPRKLKDEIGGELRLYKVVTSTYIKPGIYRINKPWEIAQDAEVCGAGFLVKMGLATFDTNRIEPYQVSEPDQKLSDVRPLTVK